ncbi:peptidase C14 caspase catalytic subunit p20 [Rhodomicrobium vannielii ATCC 17100]|uniref:Peptidase C14 caspase catalytic subunit p20 n=1 Tax=Rhodomicrobium vannielii (strain ATCC 17100 / DSM 162 / LMG 4299 / NCIMB 10020 / ATH 3.1.1) TaxID=648757 RepID=E3I571_RHOVT|nr:caspase family protein [Rhodomicrobium vannielii]ADP70521.1 peptidase C14 caspase catalytic subunit p20 [Rhodomicrobium vannielii ATCC 17100]
MRTYRRLSFAFAALGALVFALIAGYGGAGAAIFAPGGGTIRALVVGIDDYRYQRPLQGAVADAKDLDRTLKAARVPPANIALLLDRVAKRQAIVDAMERLLAEARPGDLAIIAFAGHGTRIREMYENTKPDHKDEAYVLADFDENNASDRSELIAGPEMKSWIGVLDGKGVDVLFIADTCHGGGMTRTFQPDSNILTYRQIDLSKEVQLEATSVATVLDAARDAASFPRLTFLAAADPSQKAPEVKIAGEATRRGALSYAVARAIEGAALPRGAGALSRGDLFEYARQRSLEYTNGQQTIFTTPGEKAKLGEPVFRTASGGEPVPTPHRLDARPIRVAVSNGDLALLSNVKSRIAKFEITEDKAKADLVFVPEKRKAVSDGDILAEDVSAADIPGVVDRIYASRALTRLTEDRWQKFRLGPDNSLHHAGDYVSLEADDAQGKFVIVFNITGSGQVQYLYPPAGGGNYPFGGTTWSMQAPVREPFGSDQVVAILSKKRLADLERYLQDHDGSFIAGTLPELIRNHLDPERDVRIGMATIVTQPWKGIVR